MDEIQVLKNQIRELEKQLESLVPKTSLAILCKEVPIACVRGSEQGLVFSKRINCDVWTLILSLSKKIFLTKEYFNAQNQKNFLATRNPRKITQLTIEQQKIAASFADEVICIFNKYFEMNNSRMVIDGKEYEVKQEVRGE